jgi:hypothetical protein
VRTCAATAEQLDRGVVVAVCGLQPSRMLSLAVSGSAFGLVEELVADGRSCACASATGSTVPSGCALSQSWVASAVAKKRPGLQVVARTRVVSISWAPGIEITAVAGEISVTPECGSTVRRMTVSVVGHRDSICGERPRIAGNSRVSAAHHV